uniref:Nucleoside diphosphate kinase, mitochondrial n=1 Tax=Marmota marmota marmota TaxID=9994 RepID=A0A8C5YTK6_MARMA
MESTLVAVKPDGVQRRLIGTVIQRFERRGFKLVGMKMLQVSEPFILAEHYQDLQRKPFYPALISYMSSGIEPGLHAWQTSALPLEPHPQPPPPFFKNIF